MQLASWTSKSTRADLICIKLHKIGRYMTDSKRGISSLEGCDSTIELLPLTLAFAKL